MGGGTWTRDAFTSYTATSKAMNVALDGSILTTTNSTQDIFKERRLHDSLNPKNVIRECLDTEEHPNTIPVILGLDVTGSMGNAAIEVAKKLNVVMTKLYEKVQDVEFLIMGIGDLSCDKAPIQASQFESDIRIAEQLDKIYFEFGGGGNAYESYTAAWYFGINHTRLDCWKRGKKGIIITMGDERINPYLPLRGSWTGIIDSLGDMPQADIETKDLYEEASKKFDIYHLNVLHGYGDDYIKSSWMEYLDEKHFREVSLDSIADEIVDIVVSSTEAQKDSMIDQESVSDINANVNDNGEIFW